MGVVVEITIRIKVEEVAKMVVKMVGVGLDFPWMLKMVTMVMVIGWVLGGGVATTMNGNSWKALDYLDVTHLAHWDVTHLMIPHHTRPCHNLMLRATHVWKSTIIVHI